MSAPDRRANRARAKVRTAVEHVFAEQKARMRLFRPDRRPRPGAGENRDGEPRLQHGRLV
jgi:hypothetical protein